MPLSLEPGSKNVVVLDTDKEKDAPPAFFVRSLSMRQTRKLSETYDLIWETATDTTEGDMFERLFTVLAEMVTGWANMGDFGEYEPDKLWDVLSFTEGRQLAVKILGGNFLSDEDKKKFDL